MKFKKLSSFTTLSKETLKKITAGNNHQSQGNPPDCYRYPKMMGCEQPFTPPDC